MFFEDFFVGQSSCSVVRTVVSNRRVLGFIDIDPVGGYLKIYNGYKNGLKSPFGNDEYVPGGLVTEMMTSFILSSVAWGEGPVECGGSQRFKKKMPTDEIITCEIEVIDIKDRYYPPDGAGKVTFKVTLRVNEEITDFGTRDFLITRREKARS